VNNSYVTILGEGSPRFSNWEKLKNPNMIEGQRSACAYVIVTTQRERKRVPQAKQLISKYIFIIINIY
jgi:hypothetical protein